MQKFTQNAQHQTNLFNLQLAKETRVVIACARVVMVPYLELEMLSTASSNDDCEKGSMPKRRLHTHTHTHTHKCCLASFVLK